MKILWVLPPVHGRGGIEELTVRYSHTFESMGIEFVTALTGPSLDDESWEEQLTKVVVGPVHGLLSPRGVPRWLPRLRRFLVAVTASERPDLIVYNWAPLAAIVSPGLIRKLTARHTTLAAYEHGGWAQRNTSRLYRAAYRSGLKRVDHVFCGSSDYAEELVASTGVINIHVIGLPIVLPSRLISGRPGSFHILYMGRVQRQAKRIDRLIRACAELPPDLPWRVQVVGSGADYEWARTQVDELGISDRFVWSGWQADPWSVVVTADLTAFPSEHEGFSSVLVESLAHGIPVLATNCNFGPRTLISNGSNGWLVPNSDDDFSRGLNDVVLGHQPLPAPEAIRRGVIPFEASTVARELLNASGFRH